MFCLQLDPILTDRLALPANDFETHEQYSFAQCRGRMAQQRHYQYFGIVGRTLLEDSSQERSGVAEMDPNPLEMVYLVFLGKVQIKSAAIFCNVWTVSSSAILTNCTSNWNWVNYFEETSSMVLATFVANTLFFIGAIFGGIWKSVVAEINVDCSIF